MEDGQVSQERRRREAQRNSRPRSHVRPEPAPKASTVGLLPVPHAQHPQPRKALPRCPFSAGNNYSSALISSTGGSGKPKWHGQKSALFLWTLGALGSNSITVALLIVSCNYLVTSHLQGAKHSLQAQTMPCWSLQTGLEWRVQFIYSKNVIFWVPVMCHMGIHWWVSQQNSWLKGAYNVLHCVSAIFGFLGPYTRSETSKGLKVWKITERWRLARQSTFLSIQSYKYNPTPTPGTYAFYVGKRHMKPLSKLNPFPKKH